LLLELYGSRLHAVKLHQLLLSRQLKRSHLLKLIFKVVKALNDLILVLVLERASFDPDFRVVILDQKLEDIFDFYVVSCHLIILIFDKDEGGWRQRGLSLQGRLLLQLLFLKLFLVMQVFLIDKGVRDVILDFSQDDPILLSLSGDDWLETLLVVVTIGQEYPVSNGSLTLGCLLLLLYLTVICTILDPILNSQVLAFK